MRLHYTITEDDYIKYNLYHISNSASQKRIVLILRLLMPVLFAIIFFIAIPESWVLALSIALVFSIAWFIYLPRSYGRSVMKNVKRLLQEGSANEFVGEYTLELLPDKIKETHSGRLAETPLSVVDRMGRDENSLYIYCGSITAIIIPWRTFKDSREKDAFISELKQLCPQLNN